MRAPLLDANGLVANVVLVGEGWTPPDGLTIGPAGGEIGWTLANGAWVKPVDPAPSVSSVPISVSPYQARRALNAAGLREAVETAVASASYEVRDAWEYALTVERASPMIAALAAALGLSETQVDDLFIAAAAYD